MSDIQQSFHSFWNNIFMDLAIPDKEIVYQLIANELVDITSAVALANKRKNISVKDIKIENSLIPSVSQLLIRTAPFSIKVRKFSELAIKIKKSHDANPWGLRDYSLAYKITILLDEILEEYWDDFPINSKTGLLFKLEPLIKAFSNLESPAKFIGYMFLQLVKNPIPAAQTIWRSVLLLSKLITYSIFSKTAFRELSATAILNRKAQIKLRSTIQKIREQDFQLIGSSHIDNVIDEDTKVIVANPSINFDDSLNRNKERAKQQNLFRQLFSQIINKYPNQYIVFDNGKVVDHDQNSDKLLERIFETDFGKQRTGKNSGLHCYFIPGSIAESETKEYRKISSNFMMDLWAKESASTNLEDYSEEELDAMQRVQDRLMSGE